ncbi:lymphatic vessel endothelial hyaluronic receptor 1b [Sinocyclocheilus rhinocerous]|uniref:lymphatic vessel endothelial hyaluronic receptor 1b n=1 Tax=Sinocyclocheilus rhinocerous TaxID=307959 RepID=UPI0007BAB18D|nr:PREDICTED: lymphatic vessel endothelial hyaluronic acid receptor 1-like [Sinocyclocheilus rhinocerous]
MARVWLQLCLPLFLFTSTLCVDVSLIQVPTNDGITGVLLVQTKNNVCSFNATTAKEACEAIKMRIAKRAEVETANKNGFQTCRFGWVEEQIAVIPRIEKSEKCGKNKLGVSFWRADISKMFDVYCFKPAGPNGSFETTSSRPQSTTGGRTPSNNHYSTKTTHPSSIQSTSTPAYTSRSLPPYTTTPSISFTFNTSSTTVITLSFSNISESSQAATSPLSLSSPRTSRKFSTSSPSSSSHSSTYFLLQHSSTPTGQPALSQTTTPNRPSIRAAPKTFVVISIVLLFLLAAAGAAWYLKIKRGQRFPSWTRMRPKEIIETEMWKQISERNCMPEQTSKDNNNSKCSIILQMEQDPDSP